MAISIPQKTTDQIFFGRCGSSTPSGHEEGNDERNRNKIDIKENLGKANLRQKILTVDKVALSI